jgi:hypothetical protein
MDITMTQTAAAARPRTLSLVSGLAPVNTATSPQTADWYARTQVPMRDRSVLGGNYNSIDLRPAGFVGFGAAKQAAPPRGVPR